MEGGRVDEGLRVAELETAALQEGAEAVEVQVEPTQVAMPVSVPVRSTRGEEFVATHAPEQPLQIRVWKTGPIALDAIQTGFHERWEQGVEEGGGRVGPDSQPTGVVDEPYGTGHVQESGGHEGRAFVADEPLEGFPDGSHMPRGVHDAGEMRSCQRADMGSRLRDDGVELHGHIEGGEALDHLVHAGQAGSLGPPGILEQPCGRGIDEVPEDVDVAAAVTRRDLDGRDHADIFAGQGHRVGDTAHRVVIRQGDDVEGTSARARHDLPR